MYQYRIHTSAFPRISKFSILCSPDPVSFGKKANNLTSDWHEPGIYTKKYLNSCYEIKVPTVISSNLRINQE